MLMIFLLVFIFILILDKLNAFTLIKIYIEYITILIMSVLHLDILFINIIKITVGFNHESIINMGKTKRIVISFIWFIYGFYIDYKWFIMNQNFLQIMYMVCF